MDNDFLKNIHNSILLFDFDGTLINSEKYHKIAHEQTFSCLVGGNIKLTKAEQIKLLLGKTDNEIYANFKKEYNLNFNEKQAIKDKTNLAYSMIKDLPIFDYFFEIIKDKTNELFIVSNQQESLLIRMLKEKDIFKYFSNVFCLSSTGIKKSYFYKNLDKFIELKNRKIFIFEDSDEVLKSLKELGYTTVGIETKITKGKLKHADYLITVE